MFSSSIFLLLPLLLSFTIQIHFLPISCAVCTVCSIWDLLFGIGLNKSGNRHNISIIIKNRQQQQQQKLIRLNNGFTLCRLLIVDYTNRFIKAHCLTLSFTFRSGCTCSFHIYINNVFSISPISLNHVSFLRHPYCIFPTMDHNYTQIAVGFFLALLHKLMIFFSLSTFLFYFFCWIRSQYALKLFSRERIRCI